MTHVQLGLPFVALRWRERRQSYRPQGEPINPARYAVVRLTGDAEARAFVFQHHYAASYPAAIAAFGLMEAAPCCRCGCRQVARSSWAARP